nr:hypothetical protein [Streptomyces sporangiiformans]
MSAKRVLAALPTLAALLTAFVTALLITAAPASWAKAPSPGERIATALRESPVYVDPSYEGSVPPTRQKELARQITRTGLPIKVVLTPLTKGDSFNGDSATLAEVVHDRLGLRDLILITTDGDFTDSLNGYEWPGEAHQTEDAVATVGFLDEMDDAGLADRTAKAIELIEDGDGKNAYEEATKDLGGEGDDSASTQPKSPRDEATSSWLWPTLVAVPTLAAAFVTFLFVRRRGPRLTYPRAVFTAARAADEADVRRQAEAEVLSLGESVRSAPSSTPGLQRALDAYAAAGTVLDAARGLPDLAGALALAAEGRDALDAAPAPLPLCFFNPLHGRAADRIAWRALGRRESLRVAACTTCAEAVRTRRAPEVLMDTAEDGRRLPYFEVSHSIWARTGYGSLLKDPDDGLARRVGRGDFSRSLPDPDGLGTGRT